MERYSFDKITDRIGSGCVKWDLDPEVLPMWVADMDFEAPSFIKEALRKRLDHGIFGYTEIKQSYYDAVIGWFSRRRGWNMEKEWITPVTGVIPGLSAVLHAFTSPGDKVLINTPAYNHFFAAIANNGCKVAASPLRYDVENGVVRYSIDFEDLDLKLSDPKVKLFLFCNPHNPSGRVWTHEELVKVGELCRKWGKPLVADEIHCEIEMPGFKYIPLASVSAENQGCCVTLNSSSKSFNLAGLKIANIIISDKEMRERVARSVAQYECGDVNAFGPESLHACYSPEGAEWLKDLCDYVHGNYTLLKERLKAELPEFPIAELQGTYLAWVDCRRLIIRGITSTDIEESLKEVEKVWIMAGEIYGDGSFIRINLAMPRPLFEEGLDRVVRGLKRLLG